MFGISCIFYRWVLPRATGESLAEFRADVATTTTSRPWDGFDAYLFDIDGTLLNCRDAVHYFAFCSALSNFAGRPLNLDGVATHGNTDVGILSDALHRAGIEESLFHPHLPAMQRAMCEAVLREEAQLNPEPTLGILDVLTHLSVRGALLGVATGNLEPIGWAKLRRAGLAARFQFGAFSTDAPTRPGIFAAAADRARALRGSEISICVVGDTPADIVSARANGLPVLAVATGTHSLEELAAEGPTWCVKTLRDFGVGFKKSE